MEILNKYNQYIKGNLTEEELEVFTGEIVKDHFEKEELKDKWNQILKEKHNLHETVKPPQKKSSVWSSIHLIKIGLSAAASILLLVFSWFTYQAASSPTYEKLLSQELNNPYVENLSRKGSVEELRLQAVAAYNDRDYATATGNFEQLKELDKAVDWNFYIGLCQLYQKQSDLAIQSFTAILNHPNKKYTIETNWYLGLAYVMDEDFKAAKKHLEFVVNQSNDEMAWKVKEAKALLNALSENE